MSCAATCGFEKQEITNHPQNVTAAFLGRDVMLDLVRIEQDADFVVVQGGGKREHTGDLGGALPFALLDRAEDAGGAQIDEQHQRELTLFAKDFDEGPVHFGTDVPVDGTDVIADRIFADLLEVHAASFKRAVIGTGHGIRH